MALPAPGLRNGGSLRSRLLTRVTVALIAVFAIAAVTLYLLMRASLLSEFDTALSTQAAALVSLTEQDNQKIKLELEPGELPDFSSGKRPNYFELWSADGRPLLKSVSLAEQNLTAPGGAAAHASYRFIRLPNGKAGRQISFTFKPRFEDEKANGPPDARPKQTATLAVARPTHDLDDTLQLLAWLLLGVWAAAILASVGVMNVVIRRGLIPLKMLAGSIERVGVEDLSERIRLDGTPREMTPVVQRLNDLLGRLDSAMAREKSFTADVAHELRTPLAGLETVLEVCASRRREPEAYESVIGKSLHLAQGMHAMVDNLLLLARADARQLTTDPEPVELRSFIQECWGPFESRAQGRHLQVEWKLELNGEVKLDREKTRIVLNNLFDNAVTYTDDGGRVRIAAGTQAGRTTLRVENSGSRVSPGDAAKLFDRFWRGDEARCDVGTHCGLGLSLCRKIVDLLGGTLSADSRDGQFSASVSIPTPGV